MKIRSGIAAILLVALLSQGCASKQEELESVARDWCMTIRASQVIPVYPLTEDLRPGDVFIVELPVQKQVDEYRAKGFLPLDRHATRLTGIDYRGFYGSEFFSDKFDVTPHDRIRLDVAEDEPATTSGSTPGNGQSGEKKNTSESAPAENGQSGREKGDSKSTKKLSNSGQELADFDVPLAAFPSYTFSVSNSAGLSLAIPLKGITAALGFMRTQSANGSISLGKAYSYGASGDDLLRGLRIWAEMPEVRRSLALMWEQSQSEGHEGEPNLFLRLVSRVYFVGEVDVSLMNAEAVDAAADDDPAAAEQLKGRLDALETKLQEPAPKAPAGGQDTRPAAPPTGTGQNPEKNAAAGQEPAADMPNADDAGTDPMMKLRPYPKAAIAVRSRSRRAVQMTESFTRPLAIGYVGFDVPILAGGNIGVPIATQAQLLGLKKREEFQLSQGSTNSAAPGLRELEVEKNRFEVRLTRLQQMANCQPIVNGAGERETTAREVQGEKLAQSARRVVDFVAANASQTSFSVPSSDNVRAYVDNFGLAVRKQYQTSDYDLMPEKSQPRDHMIKLREINNLIDLAMP